MPHGDGCVFQDGDATSPHFSIQKGASWAGGATDPGHPAHLSSSNNSRVQCGCAVSISPPGLRFLHHKELILKDYLPFLHQEDLLFFFFKVKELRFEFRIF